MVCCCQVTKIVSSRYGFAFASSARSPCNFGPLADLAISEMSLKVTSSRSRTGISPAEGEEGEDAEDDGERLSCFTGVLEVD